MTRISRRSLLFAAAIRAFAEELGLGKLLIATRKSRDPGLAESVVLLIHFSAQEAVGLIVNRPTHSPARGRVYDGGPIAQGIRALLRSRSEPSANAVRILVDVYLLSDANAIHALATQGASARRFRVYEGRVGWTPAQLKNEVASGLWRVIPADAAILFDPDPEGLWPRLADR